jgi:UDP-N-acetylglucosamine 4-epimerase
MRDSKINLLITGGAGFIGSNLLEYFLNHPDVKFVRVVDDLSTGYIENISKFFTNPNFEFIDGDIRDYDTCFRACKGIDKITHQAALGSVPRSVKDPIQSAEVNIMGTINLMHAAVQNDIERIVLAFSSSTYGDSMTSPKREENIGSPLSPYAVTKASIEQFADVFNKVYGLNWIGLRYFNVFGPNQNPNNPYAAVIPIFMNQCFKGEKITVNGNGETSRDFTYVKNVVHMNELSLFSENKKSLNKIYNTACSEEVSLNRLIQLLKKLTSSNSEIYYGPERDGDVKHSLADISKANMLLGYKPQVNFEEGLELTLKWLKSKYYE